MLHGDSASNYLQLRCCNPSACSKYFISRNREKCRRVGVGTSLLRIFNQVLHELPQAAAAAASVAAWTNKTVTERLSEVPIRRINNENSQPRQNAAGFHASTRINLMILSRYNTSHKFSSLLLPVQLRSEHFIHLAKAHCKTVLKAYCMTTGGNVTGPLQSLLR